MMDDKPASAGLQRDLFSGRRAKKHSESLLYFPFVRLLSATARQQVNQIAAAAAAEQLIRQQQQPDDNHGRRKSRLGSASHHPQAKRSSSAIERLANYQLLSRAPKPMQAQTTTTSSTRQLPARPGEAAHTGSRGARVNCEHF